MAKITKSKEWDKRRKKNVCKIYRKIRLVAPTNMTVLVLGENGTGKEHVAEKIHMMRKRMLVHTWGGNVRELKGTVRSAVLFTDGDVITADKLEFEASMLSGETSLSLKNEEMEKKKIIRALEQANGNRSLAALLLGIGRTTLHNKMKQHGI